VPVPSAQQRLMLRVEAAGARFAIDASQVIEVAAAPPSGEPLHGHLVLEDLSSRLGGDPEPKGENAIVLDSSPTLGLRVGKALGVTDGASARALMVPPALSRLLEPAIKGVIELGGALHFELEVEALARAALPHRVPKLQDVRDALAAPQSLVFTHAGQRYAVPLHLVRQIVSTKGMLACPLPGPLAGVVEHSGKLWPVWTAAASQREQPLPLAVLVESDAGVGALAAESAEGVRQGAALEGVMPLNVAALFS
jgi:chemotaxis signal transduction protein